MSEVLETIYVIKVKNAFKVIFLVLLFDILGIDAKDYLQKLKCNVANNT